MGTRLQYFEKLNPRWEDLAEKWGRRMLFPGRDERDGVMKKIP